MSKTRKEIHNAYCDYMVRKAKRLQAEKNLNGIYKTKLLLGQDKLSS